MSEQFPGSSHESADKAPLRKVELTKAEWQALHYMAVDHENDSDAQIVMATHGLSFDQGDLNVTVYDADTEERQTFVMTTGSDDPFTLRRMDAEVASPNNEPNKYDNLYNTDIELDERNGYSVENAAVVTPESEKNLELKTEYSIDQLEAAGKKDQQLMDVIADALKDLPDGLSGDKHTLIETLRSSEVAASSVTAYLREKVDAYLSDLPNRVQRNEPKKPNFPGGEVMNSRDVVALYAWRKISGQWDPSREDGETDQNATVGQHREAADRILRSPSFQRGIRREQ